MLDTLTPKPSKIAIFAEKTDWGAELRGLWNDAGATARLQLVADEEYAPGSQDFSQLILTAKDAGAEVVLALPNPPDGMAMVETDEGAGISTPTATCSFAPPTALAWSENLGKDGDYFLNMPGWNPALKFPGVDEMVRAPPGQIQQASPGHDRPGLRGGADSGRRNRPRGKPDRDKIRDAHRRDRYDDGRRPGQVQP